MLIAEEYKKIYHEEMLLRSKGIILVYSPLTNKYQFQPFSHNTDVDCVEKLSALMRKNLLFYSYGEEEIIKHYRKKTFSDLEEGAKYAYINRLPKRLEISDGLPGEVLLDLLIQLYAKDAYKLAVRPIMRQDDNNEIKGYDLTYFSLQNNEVTLWLGQAKLGGKYYCKKDIHKDLLEKFKKEYLSKKVFFVCDKQVGVTEECEKLTDIINKVNIATLNEDDGLRANALLSCFKGNNIKINIPCLLAYEQADVYADVSGIYQKIDEELAEVQKYFSKTLFQFEGFTPQILFYIFPIKCLERLRDNKGGFYDGLR